MGDETRDHGALGVCTESDSDEADNAGQADNYTLEDLEKIAELGKVVPVPCWNCNSDTIFRKGQGGDGLWLGCNYRTQRKYHTYIIK